MVYVLAKSHIRFHRLAKLVRRHLALANPGLSVPPERVFSLADHNNRKRWASLSPNMASKLIFLSGYMRKFKYGSYEPIDENNDYLSDNLNQTLTIIL